MAGHQSVGGYALTKRVGRGDVQRGIPEIWRAEDYGNIYYVKLWKRKGRDHDLRALWNREVRGLMRLQGYPGAGELFVKLYDLDADDKQFYAVLDSGGRVLLSEVLERSDGAAWLRNLGELGRRRLLWEGLLRTAEALSVLHSEGTLHRSVSPMALFVSPHGQSDFRLSGFEWSLRVAGSEGAASRVNQRNSVLAPELEKADGEYSIATDWFDFGVLSAELFGVRPFKKRESLREAIQTHRYLTIPEKELITHLLDDDQESRFADARNVTAAIREIVRGLSAAGIGAGRPLMLAVRLGVGTGLSDSVEASSRKLAPATDPVRQREWIERDLRGDIRITARTQSQAPTYIVHGAHLEYRLKPWSLDSSATWDVAFCEASEANPRFLPNDQRYGLGERRLEVRLLPDVRRNIQKLRDRAAPWDKTFPFPQPKGQLPPHLRDIYDFFRITQQLDTVIIAAQICPVQVVRVERTAAETEIEVTPLEEADRNDLAQYLKLSRPSQQLEDWFGLGAETVDADDDAQPTKVKYQLLDEANIESDSRRGDWRFVKASPNPKGPRYVFRCIGNYTIAERKYYLARDHGGAVAQLKRRHRAIENMRVHEDLLRMLSDPRGSSRKIAETLPAARADIRIDEAKVAALEKLWQTRPSFALQGPPGTGKTTLIEAFVDRLYAADAAAQIIITAHSHHTVDDVRRKVSSMFDFHQQNSRPIILRLGANEPTEHDLLPITERLLKRLDESELAQTSPEFLRTRLDALLRDPAGRNERAEGEFRTLEGLAQDAANITFLTCNSPQLADIAASGRRFDWSIIEEAGKAHGFDIAAALQESHRLLLIGDHHQLPPFNADVFRQLLQDPLRVRNAIQSGSKFAPSLVDRTLVEDEDDRALLTDRCELWRRMIGIFGLIFDKSAAEDGSGPAATLTQQHRMHPHIAELVGRIFYPDSKGGTIIESPESTRQRFSGSTPFAVVRGSWLPNQRIVWCDVPWVQKREWAEGESDGLFESIPEALAVVDILDQLRPVPEKNCEVQILSPYNDQLSAIRRAVEKAHRGGRLSSMFIEPFDLRVDKRLGATVDEFQGSEADIVIVSLVRNNALVPWRSVGFLKEPNRMNVLLSRARHKLILVGSWDFFESRCNSQTAPEAEYAYIGKMMSEMVSARKSGHLCRVGVPI